MEVGDKFVAYPIFRDFYYFGNHLKFDHDD